MMVYGFRYIQIDETGLVTSACSMSVEGVTIDTEGMTVPEQPTDAIYDLYFNKEKGLHWVKTGELQTEDMTEADKQDATLTYIMAMTEGA